MRHRIAYEIRIQLYLQVKSIDMTAHSLLLHDENTMVIMVMNMCYNETHVFSKCSGAIRKYSGAVCKSSGTPISHP